MKKTVLSICAILFAFITFAQQARVKKTFHHEVVKIHDKAVSYTNLKASNYAASAPIVQASNSSSSAPAPIWSEDFINGIPATWTNSTAPWVYRGPATTPNISVGSQGAYSTGGVAIVSPTASNGFIIFDSDYYDNNGSQTGAGTGPYPTPHNGDLKTDIIDMSGYTDLAVKMNSSFRTFQGQAFLKFYVNGAYDSQVEVHTDLDVNDSSEDDEVVIVRMPTTVPGNNNVQIEFQFDGTTVSNVNGSGYYYWMLDDIEVVETPRNLIELHEAVVGGWHIDYVNYPVSGLITNFYGLDYTITPTSQLANHPFSIEGLIKNKGAADQNCVLKYESLSGAAYSGSSASTAIGSLTTSNPLDSAIVGASPTLSPPIGQYALSIWAESDSSGVVTAVSDTTTKFIEVSDYEYAKDEGELISSSPTFEHPGWEFGGPTNQDHVITRYEMYANEQLYSLKAYITAESVVGSEVKAIIYEADSTATSGSLFLNESDPYTITAQDLGAWVDIPFLSPVPLISGYAYEFGIAGFQHPTNTVIVGTSGETLFDGEHSLYDELGLNPIGTATAGSPTWYRLIIDQPMVRMNFDPASATVQTFDCNGVSCIDPGNGNGAYSSLSACQANCPPSSIGDKESKISIYPNPSNGVFVIELDKALNHDVMVYNVLGQTVLSTFTNTMLTTIDLSSFDKGVYTIEIKDRNVTYIEKVILE